MAEPSLPTPAAAVPDRGVVQLRVRYCECDPMRVAHHAAYVPWLEMGRTEILRGTGVTYADMEAHGYFLVVVRFELRYRRPVRYDDLVEVRTRVSGGGRVKIEHEYEVVVVEREGAAPPEGPIDAAAGTSTLACVDRQGKPRELPGWLARS
ncbi:MAG: acyl-CoA thioesterase [Phycisphaeraceae bacterium]|nr:MAG: acyl-CoA thioesterase [Phycisphaeraceae bacterium]